MVKAANLIFGFYSTAFTDCLEVLFLPMASGLADWWAAGKVCPSETVRCRKLIHGRDIGWGCRCAKSWWDLHLTFDLAIVTLSLKIFSRLYLINHKV